MAKVYGMMGNIEVNTVIEEFLINFLSSIYKE
jgi:hypothetical protein